MIRTQSLLKLFKLPIDDAQRELEVIQSYSKEQFEDWKKKKSWETVTFHYKNTPIYKKLVGNHLPEKWEDLPIITKKDLQGEFTQNLSKGIRQKDLHIGYTSGSTGIALKYAKDKYCHSMTWALIFDRYKRVGLSPNDFQARFFGIPLDFPKYQKELLKDRMMNRFRFIAKEFSNEDMERFIRKFRSTNFIYTYGYSSSQLLFCHYLQHKNIVLKDICPSLQGTIVTSDQCTEENKLLLEKYFGVPVFNEYGASELEFLAMSDLSKSTWLSSETLVTEVVGEENNLLSDGQTGSLIFSNIFNKAMPLIRYEVGDLGAIKHHDDRIQVELTRLTGRLNDTIVFRSGSKASGLSIYALGKHLSSRIPSLKEHQVRQITPDLFEIDLLMDTELNEKIVQLVNSAFDLYLEKNLTVKVQKVDKIDREKSGKLKQFISLLEDKG